MASGKGNDQPTPLQAGLDPITVATNQTDVPHTYFAGTTPLEICWICDPVLTKITPADTGNAGK